MSTETTNPGRQVCGECMNGFHAYTATCDHTPYLDQTVSCEHCGQWLPCQCSYVPAEPAPKTFPVSLTQHELETLDEVLPRYVASIKRDYNYDHESSAWRGHLLEAEQAHHKIRQTILEAKQQGTIR